MLLEKASALLHEKLPSPIALTRLTAVAVASLVAYGGYKVAHETPYPLRLNKPAEIVGRHQNRFELVLQQCGFHIGQGETRQPLVDDNGCIEINQFVGPELYEAHSHDRFVKPEDLNP